MDPETEEFDVAVIGGGPGGSATAAFLAEAGLRTLIVEKSVHPRFHIGESLLPQTVPLLDRLDLTERVRRIGVYKPGAEFIGEDGEARSVFRFDRTFGDGPGHAFQVRRADFDKLVFDRALELGAEGWQDTVATVVSCEASGSVIDTRGPDGATRRVKARFLVDASGRSTLMANRAGEKRADPKNDSAAVFGHFLNVPGDEGADDGNIRIYLVPGGWMWRIPLENGTTSLGLVQSGDRIGARGASIEAYFRAEVSANPEAMRILEKAEVVGRMQATGNFSYRALTAGDEGHIKVGDAFGFLDPVFSTGVHLAMTGAEAAAAVVIASLDAPERRARLLARYERKLRARMDYASWFIYRIRNESFRRLMLNPRNYFGIERAVVSLLAGDLYPSWPIRFRIGMFKLIWKINEFGGRSRATRQSFANGHFAAR